MADLVEIGDEIRITGFDGMLICDEDVTITFQWEGRDLGIVSYLPPVAFNLDTHEVENRTVDGVDFWDVSLMVSEFRPFRFSIAWSNMWVLVYDGDGR